MSFWYFHILQDARFLVPEKFCSVESPKRPILLSNVIYDLWHVKQEETWAYCWKMKLWSSLDTLLWLKLLCVCLYFAIIVSPWMLWNANTHCISMSLRVSDSRSGPQSREEGGPTPSRQESQRPRSHSLILLSLRARRYLSFHRSTRHCWAVGLVEL